MASVLTEPYFNDEAAAFAELERILAEGSCLPVLRQHGPVLYA